MSYLSFRCWCHRSLQQTQCNGSIKSAIQCRRTIWLCCHWYLQNARPLSWLAVLTNISASQLDMWMEHAIVKLALFSTVWLPSFFRTMWLWKLLRRPSLYHQTFDPLLPIANIGLVSDFDFFDGHVSNQSPTTHSEVNYIYLNILCDCCYHKSKHIMNILWRRSARWIPS